MNIKEAINSLNQRLLDELVSMANTVKDIYLAGTAGTDKFVAYQIVSQYDNEVRFNIVVGSDAPYSSTPYGTVEDALMTVFVVLHSRRGRATFRYGYEAKDPLSLQTDGGVGLDDLIPWVWLADTESTRLTTEGDFPSANLVSVVKEIQYAIDLGSAVSVEEGDTVQLALDPSVTNTADDANAWISDNTNIATVTQWVEGGSLGGLVTGVAAGEVYIRNNLGAKILVTVTPAP